MKFSLCMIVKNEEAVLNRCLESMASAMDEIIIVDTGSTDATKKIATAYTDQIYDFAWTGNFAEARNYAASKATGDYIYTADADEYLEPEELQKLLQPNITLTPVLKEYLREVGMPSTISSDSFQISMIWSSVCSVR